MRELWDVYDIYREKTGKVHERGKPLIKGEYYLVVNVWIMDSNNRILLTKRHHKKNWGNHWECTGGFVQMGESSLQGALREVFEEIGVKLNKEEGILLNQGRKYNYLIDTWIFKKDIKSNELTFQDGEVIDAKMVDENEYQEMCKNKLVTPNVRNFYKLYYNSIKLNYPYSIKNS